MPRSPSLIVSNRIEPFVVPESRESCRNAWIYRRLLRSAVAFACLLAPTSFAIASRGQIDEHRIKPPHSCRCGKSCDGDCCCVPKKDRRAKSNRTLLSESRRVPQIRSNPCGAPSIPDASTRGPLDKTADRTKIVSLSTDSRAEIRAIPRCSSCPLRRPSRLERPPDFSLAF